MQPTSDPADINTGFIGVENGRCGESPSEPLVKVLKAIVGLFVEIADRVIAYRDLRLFPEVVLDLVVRDQLVLRHIDQVGLDPDTVLDWPGNTLGKRSDMPFALTVLQNLGLSFGHESADILRSMTCLDLYSASRY